MTARRNIQVLDKSVYNDLSLSRIDFTQAYQMLGSVDWVSTFNGTTDVNQMLASFMVTMKCSLSPPRKGAV